MKTKSCRTVEKSQNWCERSSEPELFVASFLAQKVKRSGAEYSYM